MNSECYECHDLIGTNPSSCECCAAHVENSHEYECGCDIFDCPHNPPMKFSPSELAATENKFKIKPGGINAIPVKGRRRENASGVP